MSSCVTGYRSAQQNEKARTAYDYSGKLKPGIGAFEEKDSQKDDEKRGATIQYACQPGGDARFSVRE
jgi:hypothetical protein